MGKGGVGVMREKAEDGSADDAGAAGQGAQAAEATGGGAEPSVDASGAGGSEAEFDESSLFDRSGRLMVNLEMFRDDNFVQDRIMPLRHVPVLTPRSDEALKRQGLLLEEIMPQFGPAYAIDASKYGTLDAEAVSCTLPATGQLFADPEICCAGWGRMRSTKASPAKSSIIALGSRSKSAEVIAELAMHTAYDRY
eukprot:COSAG02_NODE_1619_length_11636_cov_26.969836_8_plen_195_part_00